MSGLNNSWQVAATGAQIATGAASANVNVPLDSAGTKPKYVRLAATAACYVRIGDGAQTAVNTDMLIQPGDSAILKCPQGTTPNVGALQVAAAGILVITPLENS
jgi:hypothetical protein